MKIQTPPTYTPPAPQTRPQAPPPEPQPVDSVEQGPNNAPQVYGAVGAMTGALVLGRPLASIAVATAAGALGGAVLGPLGAVAGAALGLYGGIKLELKSKAGRLVGGMVGGVVGTLAGKVAQLVGARPSDAMAQECKGFSLGSLPGKLLNTHYSSHPKLSDAIAKEGAAHAQPGDVIITNDDGDYMFEIAQKAIGTLQKVGEKLGLAEKGPGVKADWTHIYTVDHNEKVIDILLGPGGPTRWPLEFAFTDNCHAKILRPNYTSPETKEKFLTWMGDQFGKVVYDKKFDLQTHDKFYCQEYVFEGQTATDPGLNLKSSTLLFGPLKRDAVTADNFDHNPQYKEVWSTGSNFWMNWLSHFD